MNPKEPKSGKENKAEKMTSINNKRNGWKKPNWNGTGRRRNRCSR